MSFRFQDTCDVIIRFLMYVMIFWLPYSSAVIEVCVILSLIVWIAKRSYSVRSSGAKAFLPIKTFLNEPIGLFLFVAFLSVVGSPLFSQSFHGYLTKTCEWFIICFLIVESFKARKHVIILLIVLGVATLSTSYDALYQYYVSYKDIFLGHDIIPGDRPTASFQSPNGLGGFLAVVIPIIVSFLFFSDMTKLKKMILSFILIPAVWVLILTQSRGAWLGTGAGLLLLAYHYYVVKKNGILFPKKRSFAFSF